MHSPARTTKTILAFILSAAVFLDYWIYSQQFYREPLVYTDVLNGTAPAPNQYRIGVIEAANYIARHAHLGLRHAMTILDGLSAAIAVYLLYALVRRSETYKAAPGSMRWLASAAFVVLVQYDLLWLTWYQRPETLPTAALVALALWFLTPGGLSQNFPRGLLVVSVIAGLLVITAVQSLIRADVAVALNLGILLACLSHLQGDKRATGFPLPRSLMIATSLLGIAIGGGIQLYIMRVAYPRATYGATPVFQLVLNVTDRLRIFPFLIFLLPFAWTLAVILRPRLKPAARQRVELTSPLSPPSAALLTGSVLFLILWCVMGKIDEVRIFLPFALALAPLTTQLLIQRLSTFP